MGSDHDDDDDSSVGSSGTHSMMPGNRSSAICFADERAIIFFPGRYLERAAGGVAIGERFS